MTAAPGPLRRWVLAARPRTLPAAAVPVVVGAQLVRPASINWVNSVLCLVIALALQIGTNYANDYSDGVRGTDEVRVGPFRLTASKLVAAKSVRNAACAWFFARVRRRPVARVAHVVVAGRHRRDRGAAGWFYTGGPRPYGYYGFGELFVFVYFGLVATVGTAYVQHLTIPTRAWWLGVATGFMACALLEANNLRDVEGDRAAGQEDPGGAAGRQQRAVALRARASRASRVGMAGARTVVVGIVAVLVYVPALRLAFSDDARS